MVEAQHIVSTLKLVDTVDDHYKLERLIDATKPLVPPECRGLDYLLSTPFRYQPYAKGSRFRRAAPTPGVFYASEKSHTAVAEIVFYRLLFFAESPGTPWPKNALEFTAFAVAYATQRAIDLARGALANDHALWRHPIDYGATQDLADQARHAQIEVIRYLSVRDPENRHNLALLSCKAFAESKPKDHQTWRIQLNDAGALVKCESPGVGLNFPWATFATDPRIKAFLLRKA